jgi:hypothetical protein
MHPQVREMIAEVFVRDKDGEILVCKDGGYESMEPRIELLVQRVVQQYDIRLQTKDIKPNKR